MPRAGIAVALSLQVIVGPRPWFLGGGFTPRAAHAAGDPGAGTAGTPPGAAPSDRLKSDVALGFSYAVDPNSGSFNSQIPIEVPPGRLGLEPKLALAYSSASTVPDLAGEGWSLVLPAIRTAPDSSSVASESYRLDGQRLIATATDTYATERDRYGKVTRACTGSTCTFTADDRGGARMKFGSTAESRQPGAWGLDRVEDAHGNAMTISYMTDADLLAAFGTGDALRDGALLPRELRYGGSATVAGWYAVRFDYELRPAGDDHYYAWGWGTQRLHYRLKAIRVVGNDNVEIRRYALAYGVSATGRSQLTGVTVTGLAGATGPKPYVMTYATAPTGFAPPTGAIAGEYNQRTIAADVNGDGRADLVTYRYHDDGGAITKRWTVQLGGPTGLPATGTSWLTNHEFAFAGAPQCVDGRDRVYAGDWDGDGDADLLHYRAGCGAAPRWQVLVADGDHFTVVDWLPAAITGWGSDYDLTNAQLVFGDFTGDGRADALIYRGGATTDTLVRSIATAPGYLSGIATTGLAGPLVAVGDFDGDRRLDLAALNGTSLTMRRSMGYGGFMGHAVVTVPSTAAVTAGDFTGDGLTDLLVRTTPSSTAATLYSSTRSGMVARAVTAPTTAGNAFATGDVDGDGRDDFVAAIDVGSGQWVLRTWLQRGFTWLAGASAGYPDLALGTFSSCVAATAAVQLLLPDVTGDGRADPQVRLVDGGQAVCAASRAGTTSYDAPAVDRLASIRSPAGLTAAVTYARASGPAFPISLAVVKDVTLRDFPRADLKGTVSPVIETHRYTFFNGRYDTARGELMGFGAVTEMLPERNLSTYTTYAQDLPRRGLPLQRQDTRMSPFAMLSTDDYVYTDDPTAPYRSELAWHLRTYYTSNVATARALTGFEYDDRGNRSRVIEHGLCGRTDDDRTTDTVFRTGTDFLVSRPGQIDLYRGAPTPPASLGALAGGCAGSPLALVESTRHEYDGSATAITRGDLSRTSSLAITAGGSSWQRRADYSYRADGLLLSTTDGRGNVSQIVAYDPTLDLYPARVRDAAGNETALEIEPHVGQLSKRTDANGAIETRTYDGFGRIKSVHTPLSDPLWLHTATYAYGDDFPNWTATITPVQSATGALSGAAAVEFRDALGRTIARLADGDSSSERTLSHKVTYFAATQNLAVVYPPTDQAVTSCGTVLTCLASWATSSPTSINWASQTATSATPARLTYDPLGRATRRDNPDGSYVTYDHTVDDLGFGLREVNEVGDQRRLFRDARGELARVERWATVVGPAEVTTYQRDPRGKLTQIVRPGGATTTLTWSSLGLLDRVGSPDLGTLTYTYDADGHELTRTDARGKVTTTAVDALGRPVSRSTTDGDYAVWAYDRQPMCIFTCATPPTTDNTMGRPWAVLDASGFTTFAYDRDGHLARETRALETGTFTTAYTNWPTGVVVAKTYPDGELHRYGLAPDGRPNALVINGAATPAVALTRDALGRPATVTASSGARTQYTTDPLTQRMTAIDTYDALGRLAQHLGYAYRPDGTVDAVHRTDLLIGASDLYLDHDGAKRVTDVYVAPDTTTPAEHYAYDADGRMTTRQDRGVAAVTVGHADPAHPAAVTSVGARAFTHDASGNRLTEATAGATTHSYGYDSQSRLATVDGGAASYLYDADGRRVIEHVPGGTRTALPGYTVEPDGSTRKQLALGDLIVGERASTTGNRLFHADPVGSVVGETSAAGLYDAARSFSAFGVPVDVRGGGSRYGFGGYPTDAVSGLSFANARLYDPTTASFTTPDSWLYGFDNPDALNAYAYAANSPHQYSDPSGHFVLLALAAVSFAIGVFVDASHRDQTHASWFTIIGMNFLIAVGQAAIVALPLGATGQMLGRVLVAGAIHAFWANIVQGGVNMQTGGQEGMSYLGWAGFLAGAVVSGGTLAASEAVAPFAAAILGVAAISGLTTSTSRAGQASAASSLDTGVVLERRRCLVEAAPVSSSTPTWLDSNRTPVSC